ncbi:MAG: hypothetical protein CBC06_007700 [bacterium TMED46]|nr:MAG: hypothetical protein CBC06_007700 [bacterium TMED46]|tara:strand:+ start:5152 stop:5475 length:324 start_codon:yes stop_codon:yes gene_type:complete
MLRKRLSKKAINILQSIIFFLSSVTIISCLIVYLWVYTEIDETLLAIEIQNSTVEELQNLIDELNNEIESLERADVIAKRAQNELKMVFIEPETLRVTIDPNDDRSL